MHQLASDLRAGRVALFVSGKPGPKGPRTALPVRGRVLELRAADRSVTEIAAALTATGTPVSAQTVWSILAAEGLERLPRRDRTGTGAPPRAAAAKAQVVRTWPAGTALASDFAGLFGPVLRSASPGAQCTLVPGYPAPRTNSSTPSSTIAGSGVGVQRALFVVGGVPVRLELEGDLEARPRELEAELVARLCRDTTLVLDLRGATFLGAGAARLLLDLRSQAAASGVRLVLWRPEGQPFRTLRIVRFDRVFELRPASWRPHSRDWTVAQPERRVPV
jgi:anti-anti-sigma factor